MVQVVENVEERVLGLCQAGKFLHVIYDEHVYRLVEVDEVVHRVFPHGVRVLHLEQVCGDIQHPFFGMQFLDFRANGIYQMCFAHA